MAAYLGKMKMQGRKKVYVETSVISNLTARRSYNLRGTSGGNADMVGYNALRI